MHLVQGNYGQQGNGSSAPDAPRPPPPSHGAGPQHGGGSHNTRSMGALRGLRAGLGDGGDDDDVEDIVRQVRRDVATMQHRDRDEEMVGTIRPLGHSASEATFDRPKTRDREDERPRPMPKAAIRGRYVFGGSENQVLGGALSARGGGAHGGGAAAAAPGFGMPLAELSHNFSPRLGHREARGQSARTTRGDQSARGAGHLSDISETR